MNTCMMGTDADRGSCRGRRRKWMGGVGGNRRPAGKKQVQFPLVVWIAGF
jgi:hypothetical protein